LGLLIELWGTRFGITSERASEQARKIGQSPNYPYCDKIKSHNTYFKLLKYENNTPNNILNEIALCMYWDKITLCMCLGTAFGYLGPLHTQGPRTMTIANEELSLVEKAETVQVHFTLGGEGLKAQRKIRG
jgi:hypothetical protein